MKELYYFKHDYNARNDKKLRKLLRKKKPHGLGIYWCLIEILYEDGGFIELDEIETIAESLFTDKSDIVDIIENFELFKNDEATFWSEEVLIRLERAKSKSDKARGSALSRWQEGDLPKVNPEDYNKLTPKLKANYLERFNQIRETLPQQNSWINIIAKGRGKTEKSIRYYLSRFFVECHEKEDIYKNALEYKSYFINWLNKKIR